MQDIAMFYVPEAEPSPQWRRQWMIKFLRGEHEHGACPERGAWTMSAEDIERMFAVFEASGFSPEDAEKIACFLPEEFCRKCLDLGGIHIAQETAEDLRLGRRMWMAGTPTTLREALGATEREE